MEKKKIILFVSALAVLVSPLFCAAADVSEEDVTPRNKKIYLEPERSIIERGKFKFLLATTQGYDNNSHLDSARDGDAYFQTFFRGTFTTSVSKKTEAFLGYELMNLLYAGEGDLDLLRNGIQTGISHNLTRDLSFSAEYDFDSIEYINSGNDDYLDNQVGMKLKYKLPHKMYMSLGHNFMLRNYADRLIRTAVDTFSEKKREDIRHTVEYEVGKYFTKDFFKVGYQYFFNNSNEKFLNYYDYDSHKIGASFTHLFNDKFTGYLSISKQFRDYRSRTLVNDAGCREHERTFLTTAALYYSFNKSISFGLSYTYRENKSNEPVEEYSGSLVSISTYYRF
ncbi:MAG: MtrB/PioB family outer membrane beta-barrel protein [Candidatus Omnitrophota bacterium]